MDKLKRIDYLGTLIILLAAILFLLALNFGGELFPWGSAAVIVPLVFSFVFAGLLAFVESKFAKEPILPPRLFKNRSILAIIITNWWFGLTFFSLMYYLPIYFQIVKGDTAMWSGKCVFFKKKLYIYIYFILLFNCIVFIHFIFIFHFLFFIYRHPFDSFTIGYLCRFRINWSRHQ